MMKTTTKTCNSTTFLYEGAKWSKMLMATWR